MSADHLDDADFDKYLDSLLRIAGLTNVEAERISGVDATVIQKWRKGTTKPSIDRLRPLADALGISRVAMFVRAGLLDEADVQVRPILLALEDALSRLPSDKAATMEQHLQLILDAARREADTA